MYQLSEQIKLIKVSDPTADGTTPVNSASVDMWAHGAQGVMFFTSLGTAAADNTMTVAQSTDDQAFADTAANVASGASDEDLWLDVWRPDDQYVRAEIARGTSTTVGDIWAILYGLRVKPANNTTTGTIAGAYSDSPAEV